MILRPNWDDYFLNIAYVVATRADCSRRQVGAVLVDSDNRIISTGYNGSPSGQPGCLTDNACPRGASGVEPGSSYDTGPGACISIHAEANALLYADPSRAIGATMYVTDTPCGGCTKLLAGMKIKVVLPHE